MSIVRLEISNAGMVASGVPAPITRTTPEGTGEFLIRVDIETTVAEIGRAHSGYTLPQRDVVVAALRQVLQRVASVGL